MSELPNPNPQSPLIGTKADLLRRLKRLRIAEVEIAYNGEGDDGQIEDVLAFDKRGKAVSLDAKVRLALYGEIKPKLRTLQDVLNDFAWLVLHEYHGGYENNEGGFGTIVIDVAQQRICIDHNDRIVDVCNTVTEV